MKNKINILKENNDGFKISEEDMKLRGYGDLLGFKQSGIQSFRLADPVLNEDLFLSLFKSKYFFNNTPSIGNFFSLIKIQNLEVPETIPSK